MNTNIIEKLASKPAVTKVGPTTADDVAQAKLRHELVRDSFIASLPEATEAQLKEVIASVENAEIGKKVEGLNVTFKLSEAQKASVKAAKDRHEAAINAPEVKTAIVSTITRSRLRNFKFRETSKGISWRATGLTRS